MGPLRSDSILTSMYLVVCIFISSCVALYILPPPPSLHPFRLNSKKSTYTIICTHTMDETMTSCLRQRPLLKNLTFTIVCHPEHLLHCVSAYEGDLIRKFGLEIRLGWAVRRREEIAAGPRRLLFCPSESFICNATTLIALAGRTAVLYDSSTAD